jgi:hypothetical protein
VAYVVPRFSLGTGMSALARYGGQIAGRSI